MKFGIGEWRMRNGEKAVINYVDNRLRCCLTGYIDKSNSGGLWTEKGMWMLNRKATPYDLIEPWGCGNAKSV